MNQLEQHTRCIQHAPKPTLTQLGLVPNTGADWGDAEWEYCPWSGDNPDPKQLADVIAGYQHLEFRDAPPDSWVCRPTSRGTGSGNRRSPARHKSLSSCLAITTRWIWLVPS